MRVEEASFMFLVKVMTLREPDVVNEQLNR